MKDQFFIDYDETVFIQRKSKPKPVPMFKVRTRLGGGGFGAVYEAKNLDAKEQQDRKVVLKMERADAQHPQLKIEHRIYTKLHNRESTRLSHFAFFHRFQSEVELAFKFRPDTGIYDGGLESGRALFNILALEQLGPDLDKILRHAKKTDFCKKNNHLNKRNKGLSFTTVVNIGEQLFSGLQYLHEKCIIHRDIKPLNICAGQGQRAQNIFIVDFGLSKTYKNGDNLMEDEHYSGPGTSMYKSINITKGSSQGSPISSASLRDDCISAIYVLLEMYKGNLWWSKLDPRTEAGKVHEKKTEWLDDTKWKEKGNYEELLPLCQILEDLHVTEFNEMPPYKKIMNELEKMKEHQYFRNEDLDWLIKENGFDGLWNKKKIRKSH